MDHTSDFPKTLQLAVTACYKMNVPETPSKDPNLYCKTDLGAWQVAFQSPKCISTKYFKYLSNTFPSSSGHHFLILGLKRRRGHSAALLSSHKLGRPFGLSRFGGLGGGGGIGLAA
jgi:hypothetical protein